MTENQWPQSGSTSAGPVGTESALGAGSGEQSAVASKADAAKGSAQEVAQQAGGAAGQVAGTAKQEAAHVASEVKSQAQDLLGQAKSTVTEQVDTQHQRLAGGVRTFADQLESMAGSADSGVASDLVNQLATRTSSVASWLESRDAAGVLEDVKGFARQRPAAFLAIAAGAGVLVGRLTKGLTAGAPGTGTQSGTSDTYGTAGTAGVYPPVPAAAPLGSVEPVPAYDATDLYAAEPTALGENPASTYSLPGDAVPGNPSLEDPYSTGGRI
jgi:uncharacterized protein YjbJ (UPF0337 family)